ncbi:MAG: DNA-directed RNA polymerase subunit N [Thermoplasmata archaeon]
MIIPVRCFTCGKVIGAAYEEYKARVNNGENPKDVLDSLGIKRYCCRRIFISHADLIDDVAPFG